MTTYPIRLLHGKLGLPLGWLRYRWCLATGRPYFGDYLAAWQGLRERYEFLPKLARAANASRILEIGSWAGASTIVWARAVGECGRVVCVDPWQSYHDARWQKHARYRRVNRACRRERIYPLFRNNVAAAGVAERVVAIRAPSRVALPLLQRESFDLVYVDGDHTYAAFRNDLEMAMPLVRDGGILAGPGYNLPLHAVNRCEAEMHRDSDYILSSIGQRYHPGITLALNERFGDKVGQHGEVWYVQKSNKVWSVPEL